MPYIGRDDLRAYLALGSGFMGGEHLDEALESAVVDASAWIDERCPGWAPFTVPDPATATPRIYQPVDATLVETGPFATTDGLTVEVSSDRSEWTELDASRWWPGPDSSVAKGWAFREIRTLNGEQFGPFVRVTAVWGWPATPPQILRATKLVAHWLYKRINSPFGIEAFAGEPVQVPYGGDPDVHRLLAPFRDPVVG